MPKRPIDHTDLHIINLLLHNGQLTFKELAKRIGLSTTPTFHRVQRLMEMGIVQGPHYQLNPASIGLTERFFVKISVPDQLDDAAALEQFLLKDELVEEAHALKVDEMTGMLHYRVLLCVSSVEQLKQWNRQLMAQPGNKAIVETEAVGIPLKKEHKLKLGYKHKAALRKWQDGRE